MEKISSLILSEIREIRKIVESENSQISSSDLPARLSVVDREGEELVQQHSPATLISNNWVCPGGHHGKNKDDSSKDDRSKDDRNKDDRSNGVCASMEKDDSDQTLEVSEVVRWTRVFCCCL